MRGFRTPGGKQKKAVYKAQSYELMQDAEQDPALLLLK